MPQATVTQIDHDDATGRVHIRWGKHGMVFQTVQHARQWVDDQLSVETLRALALRSAIKKSPALKSPSVIGSRASIDFTLANPVEVT